MDPNAALKDLRAAIAEVDNELSADEGAGLLDPFGEKDHLRDLVESFQALDGWLSRGGFLPFDWDR
jgi:hypothetical protein